MHGTCYSIYYIRYQKVWAENENPFKLKIAGHLIIDLNIIQISDVPKY